MPAFGRLLPLLPVTIALSLLPFFEGGETATGLFLIHSLVFLALAILLLRSPRLAFPRFILMLLPFIVVLFINTWLTAPYKFAAFLMITDYCLAVLFAIVLLTAYDQNQPELSKFARILFIVVALGTLVSLVPTTYYGGRIRGSFANPNDFASFSVLLILLGMFQYQYQTARAPKIIIILLCVLLGLAAAASSSRAILVAVFILGVAYVIKRRPRPAVIAAMVVLFTLVSYFVASRFSGTDPYSYYRFKIWKHTLKGVLQDPYLGIGLNMLQHRAEQFNFPAEIEVGRYARIARTVDNQYFQILAETGFLGFFTFLIGWIAVYLTIRRFPDRFLFLRYAYFFLSLIAIFLLPLQNTAILYLFLSMVILPVTFDPIQFVHIPLHAVTRVFGVLLVAVMFVYAVLYPYLADRQWKLTVTAKTLPQAEIHLKKAVQYNPYQPYYRFSFVKSLLDSNPQLNAQQWTAIVKSLNETIRLNPLEADFYMYKAKALRQQYAQTGSLIFFTQAVSSYHAALDRNPYNVFMRAEFALFLMRAGRLDQAEAELHKILEAEPAYLNARLLLAELSSLNRNFDKARAQLAKEEELERRYARIARTTQDGYIKKLLSVNQLSKQEIKKSLFSTGTSPPTNSNL